MSGTNNTTGADGRTSTTTDDGGTDSGNIQRDGVSNNIGNKKNQNNNYNKNIHNSNPRYWKGNTEEIGCVLGLKSDTHLEYKKSYNDYHDAVCDFIIKDNKEFGKFLAAPFMFKKNPLEYYQDKKTPTDPSIMAGGASNISKSEEDMYKKKLERFIANEDKIEAACVSVFTVVEGNCSDAVMEQLRHKKDYIESKMNGDVLWILSQLKEITSGLEVTTNKNALFYDALVAFALMRQGDTENDESFTARFKDSIDTLFAHGGKHIFASPQVAGKVDLTNDEKLELNERFKTVAYMKKLNRSQARYGALYNLLHEQDVLGNDAYPVSLSDAYNMMVIHKSKKVQSRGGGGPRNNQVSRFKQRHQFIQHSTGKVIEGTDGRTFSETKCYNCNNMGHISTFCPEVNKNQKEGATMAQIGVCLAQKGKEKAYSISKWWVLLDTCSSATTVCNKALLHNIVDASEDESILLHSDGGVQLYNKVGIMNDFPLQAMYNPNGIANVISLKDMDMIDGATITMDTSVDPSIRVTLAKGQKFIFQRCMDGLYYLDLAPFYTKDNGKSKPTITPYYTFNQLSTSPTTIVHDLRDDISSVNQGAEDTMEDNAINNTTNQGARRTNTNHTNQGARRTNPQIPTSTSTISGANQQLTKQSNTFNPLNYQHLDIITTVQQNKKHFTKKEISRAIKARRIQQLIGWPSKSGFMKIIANNHLNNCNVTVDDVMRAEYIFGTPPPLIKGKTTRPPSQSSYNLIKVPIPLPILQHHSKLDIYIDFMYVNRIPFLHIISSKIGHRFTTMCKSRTKDTIINEVNRIIEVYRGRGFQVMNIHGDNEFNIKELIDIVSPTNTVIYPPNEHVNEVERSIRTMKERSRCTCHAVPYTIYTKLMTEHLVKYVTQWLNTFPSETSVCKYMSPAAIIEGKHKPDMSKEWLPFGAFAVVYTSTSNNMKSRGVDAISLSEVGLSGGQYFMSLETGAKIHGYEWENLPISDTVIERVHELATIEKQPKIKKGEPMYEWSPGVPILSDFDEMDINEVEEPQNMNNENILDVSENEDESEDENRDDEDDVIQITDEDDVEDDTNSNDDDIDDNIETSDSEDNHDDGDMMNQSDDENDNSEDADNENNSEPSEIDQSNDTRLGDDELDVPSGEPEGEQAIIERPRRTNAGAGVERLQVSFGGKIYHDELHKQFTQKSEKVKRGRWSNRKRRKSAIQLLQNTQKEDSKDNRNKYMNTALEVMFTQMTAKRGMKLFGEEAVAAIFKEYKQLDQGAKEGNPVVTPTPYESLTEDDKYKALDAVNLIQQKRCGKIKGRCTANGSKQRKYLSPDESVASPTVSLEGLIASLVIDANEGRMVNTFDVPGAFLQAPMPEDKKILLKLKGEFVDIMCRVNNEHLNNVRYEKNEKVLYLKVDRAIYGCIESALMWYKMFTEILEEMGFKINPYDKCVANKMINGKQCTIVWYVDDVKISHMDQTVLDDITTKMQEHFGPMEIIKGNEHSYLGMNITINRSRKVIEIEMKQQLLETIEAFNDEVPDKVSSPAARHIFDTRDGDVEKLCKEKAENFHHITAKLLHIMKRARPDIEIPVVFLCTRVKSPDTDDWKKLQRVLAWIKGSIDETRFIGADNLKNMYTWVDAAYAVHPNMRSHTGGAISMGTGVIHCKSSRQKLNTKSSTEAELVGVSDYIPYNIWLMHFMKEQGYEMEINVLYQDNQSAMKMERNGRNSCTGNSRHVNIRYFWVKDKIEKGEVDLKYCPTEKMLGDYYTKALQGAAFKRFWDVIMGHKQINSLHDIDNIKIEDSNIEEREDMAVGMGDNNTKK